MNTHESNVRSIRLKDDDAEAQQRRVEYIRAEFMQAAKLGDMSAPAPWAPVSYSWITGYVAPRASTVGEAIFSACDLGEGPTTGDVLAVLCKAAIGKSDEFSAYQLLNRLADSFIRHCI